MKNALTVTALGTITAATIAAVALVALWAASAGPPPARANHNVTVGLDMDPLATPANTATTLGTIEDCVTVTAGAFNDDGDGQTDEDPLGDPDFNGNPDEDGDTLIDEDPPGQLFDFDVWITDVGEHGDVGLLVFSMPLVYDETVINIAAVDVFYFLTAQGNPVIDASDPTLPDSDGRYEVAAADTSDAGPSNIGTGVLARVTAAAMAPGVSAIDIAKIDLNGDTVLDRGPFLRGRDESIIGDTELPFDTFFDGPVSGGTVAVDDALTCDPDWDDDTVLNEVDNCLLVANGPAQAGIPRVGNQTNTDGDSLGDACDPDIDGDGFPNVTEDFHASNALNKFSLVEVCDGVDNDGDTVVDEDGLDHDNDTAVNDPNPTCNPSAPGTDYDADGFANNRENWMATDIYDNCSDSATDRAWPPDINNNRTVNVVDVLSFGPVILSNLGDSTYNRRFDFNANGGINIIDVLMIAPYILASCTP